MNFSSRPIIAPATPGLSAMDFRGLLELTRTPDQVRQLMINARDAEKAARGALAELTEGRKKTAEEQAANEAAKIDLEITTRRLAEERAQLERDRVALRVQAEQQSEAEAPKPCTATRP